MRKMFFLSIAMITVVAFLPSCKKLAEKVFPGIDVQATSLQLTIPPIPIVVTSEVSLGSFTAPFNLDSIVKANTSGDFGVADISSIKVKQVVISLLNGDVNNNLANFQSARATLSSNTNTTATNLLSVNFPDSVSYSRTIIPTNPSELISYLKGNQITYSMYGTGRRTTNTSLNMIIAITVTIK